MARPITIDLTAVEAEIKYTNSDDISITAEVLETVGGIKGPIVWGTAVGVAHIRPVDDLDTITTQFTVNCTVNGELSLFLAKATVWTLGTKRYRFSVQITRNSRTLTYLTGTLVPSLEATHP